MVNNANNNRDADQYDPDNKENNTWNAHCPSIQSYFFIFLGAHRRFSLFPLIFVLISGILHNRHCEMPLSATKQTLIAAILHCRNPQVSPKRVMGHYHTKGTQATSLELWPKMLQSFAQLILVSARILARTGTDLWRSRSASK
jgi:hypothetical protein